MPTPPPPTAQTILYCVEDDVKALLSEQGVNLLLDDDNSGTPVDTILTGRGINYATAKVNLYCQSRYDASALVTSWIANEWATIIAARWLCTRRGNGVPESIQDMYDEALADMKLVQAGQMQLPDIATRNVNIPAWSNVVVRPEYTYRKSRVERPLSEQTPTRYRQTVDFVSENYWEI